MEENFKNIIQRVSIVDVLAFIIPGMFLILNVCWLNSNMMQDIFGPVERVFPDNLIMRIVYFGFMAYVTGMLVSEASWIIEKFFDYLDDISNAIYKRGQPQENEGEQRRRQLVISNILEILCRRLVKISNILVIFSVVFGVCLSLGVSDVAIQVFLLSWLAFGSVCFSHGIWLEITGGEQSQSGINEPQSNENASAQALKPWLGALIGIASMGIPTGILLLCKWKTTGLVSLIKSDSIWETVGLLLFVGGGSVWLRRAATQTHDIKSLEQPELFRKAQLFQAYYELFRAFLAVVLILYFLYTFYTGE